MSGGCSGVPFFTVLMTVYRVTQRQATRSLYCHLKLPSTFKAHKKLVPMQPGDVPVTYADTTALEEDFGFRPSTSLRDGLRKFAE